MFYGAGAGGDPTATAVVGDLVTVARNLLQGGARDRRRCATNSTAGSGRWTTRATSTT